LAPFLLHPETDLGFEGIVSEGSGGIAVSDADFRGLGTVDLAINDRRRSKSFRR
jgi:hypothetical protein